MPERRSTTGRRSDGSLAHLARIVGAPAFMVPWLDRFYDAVEVELVLEAAAGSAPGALPRGPAPPRRAPRRPRSRRRRLSPSSFHARYELWALFEDWQDVPATIRDELNAWELADYLSEVGEGIARHARRAATTESDQQRLHVPAAGGGGGPAAHAAPHIYLWPCNCRAMMGKCDKSHAVCLRFDNDRGLGWELTHERAVTVLRQADAEGLMHTAYLSTAPRPPRHLQLLHRLLLPNPRGREARRSRRMAGAPATVAVVDEDACTPLPPLRQALPLRRHHRAGEEQPPVIDVAACRGCGVCSTGCDAGAIAMEPLA